MPFQVGALPISGGLDNLVFYKLPGVDKMIVRKRGNISKERFKYGKEFEGTRKNNSEFRGCVKLATFIRNSTGNICDLADYNFSGALNGLCKSIQKEDQLHRRGERSILLSASPNKLEGFGFNKYYTFDSLLRSPLNLAFDRGTATADITIPSLVPDLQLYNPKRQPLYRFKFMLSIIPDLIFKTGSYELTEREVIFPGEAKTNWFHWTKGSPETNLQVVVKDWVAKGWAERADLNLVLFGGIEFGIPDGENSVKYVKYSGAAKILKVF